MVRPCCNVLPLLFILDLPFSISDTHDAITGHTQYNATVKMHHIIIIHTQAKTDRPPNVNSSTVSTVKGERE